MVVYNSLLLSVEPVFPQIRRPLPARIVVRVLDDVVDSFVKVRLSRLHVSVRVVTTSAISRRAACIFSKYP